MSVHIGDLPMRADAVIIGGGIAGLSAAWELARQGLRPLVCEARGYMGGLVASAEVAGVEMDLGAEAFVPRGESVLEMTRALGLDVVDPSGGRPRLFLPGLAAGDPWSTHTFPADSFLGIPAHPLADDVRAILGPQAAERAAEDREIPGETGTDKSAPRDMASFVAARMGSGVLERLVRPIVAGIHASDPEQLDADTIAPGLREATARLGSLQAAVGELLEKRRTAGTRSGDVTTLGGLTRLIEAQQDFIGANGGRFFTRLGAQRIYAVRNALGTHSGQWDVTLAATQPAASPSDEPVACGSAHVVRTERLIIACSLSAARRLLRGAGVHVPFEIPAGAPISRHMLVLHSPALDAAPLGSGVLVAPGHSPVRAKALSHLSVKWPWIGEDLQRLYGEGTHALRLSYGRPGEAHVEVSLEEVLRDASILTGVELADSAVIAHKVVNWDGTLPPLGPQLRERAAAVCADAAACPGLGLTGAWVAGTGIASVVAHARECAARLGKR